MKTNFSIVVPVLALTAAGVVGFLIGPNLGRDYADAESPTWQSTFASTSFFIVAAALCLVWSGAQATSLARDLRHLPLAFRQLVREGRAGSLPGEGRRDALGLATRNLARLGRRLHVDLSNRAEIERLAVTDPLTDLPNRRALMSFLEARIPRLDRSENLALLHVDLDHFKVINDTLGHEAGDAVLKEATSRMTAVLRGSDMLARLGGDEFIIVAHGIRDTDVLEILADRVVQQFARPIPYRSESCTVGASVGAVLARGTEGPHDTKRLLSDTDVALCEAKASGRNRWSVFTEQMAADIQQRSRQSREIREALLDGEFRAWFQPVIDRRAGKVIGIELLSRWEHPERGLLLPHEFLLPAETHNMFEEIGMQVLEQACQTLSDWQVRGLDVPVLHINMTRAQLVAPGVVDKVSWILDDCNIAPDKISFEINERNCEGRSVELVMANLARFRRLGAHMILDDFGGYSSSLGNIVKIGADQIKCDRMFAADLTTPDLQADAERVLKGVVAMCRTLGVEVIAKGVEETSQMEAMRGLQIERMQGDALAPAMSGEDLVQFLATHNRASNPTSGSGPA